MPSKQGWAVVDKISGDILEINLKIHYCEVIIRKIKSFEENGFPFKDYLAQNLEIKPININLVV